MFFNETYLSNNDKILLLLQLFFNPIIILLSKIIISLSSPIKELVAPFYEKTEEAKAAKLEMGKESAAVILPRLDAQVKRNGGYLVGGKLTWADIYFTAGLDLLNYQIGGGDFIAKYDNLKAVRDKVLAQPGIKAWVAKRPKSDY